MSLSGTAEDRLQSISEMKKTSLQHDTNCKLYGVALMGIMSASLLPPSKQTKEIKIIRVVNTMSLIPDNKL